MVFPVGLSVVQRGESSRNLKGTYCLNLACRTAEGRRRRYRDIVFRFGRRLAAVLLCLLPAVAWPLDWTGRVVAVHDGDTLTVLAGREAIKVRLDEIDAPELRQAYGRVSKKSLSALCFGRHAEVREQGRDKYGRVLGRVICAGTDANAEQVRRGYAWFYAQYGRDPALRDLESSARARRVGLWADPNPAPPWEFRHEGASESFGPGGGSGSRSGSGGAGARAGRCGAKKSCGDMTSCEEAMYYLHRCRLTKLDRNRDGVPCESLCR